MIDNVEFELVVCGFCGNNHYDNYESLEDWNIVKCKGCGFHYTNPRPKLSVLDKYYDSKYFKDVRHSKKFHNSDGTIRKTTESYFNRIETIESNIEKRGRLLEIGAARGGFLNVMKDRGWHVDGVEISKDAVGLAKEIYGIDLFLGIYQDFQPKEKFDVICMYQTLEHVPDPKQILEKSYRLLNEGGLLIVEVPNIKGFDIKKDKDRRYLVYDLPRHLNHFSPKFLVNQMTNMGYEILEVDRYYPQFVLDLINRKKSIKDNVVEDEKSEISMKKNDLPLLKNNKSWKLRLVDKFSVIYPGWRFTVIAKK
jgi:2-polyprenyl-3-methyl-5-hydroxy-6-metoxy-1,4-benzoquinol methylase